MLKSFSAIIILAIIILIIDISLYFKYIQLVSRFGTLMSRIFRIFYWLAPIFMLFFAYIMLSKSGLGYAEQSKIYWVSGLFIILYIPKIIILGFSVPEYILNFSGFIMKKLSNSEEIISVGNKISRIEFLSQLGFISGFILFGSLVWGTIVGKTKYTINRLSLKFKNLPKNFDGFKIVQISDIHLGSWSRSESSSEFFRSVVDSINKEKPDIIVFTGDLVNNVAVESDYWIPYLAKLNAKYGKFSILGNHDYGKYTHWDSDEQLALNMNHLYENHKAMGFNLLRNQNESIHIGSESIKIVGVENWGEPPFPQIGDYNLASKNLKANDFKILLSHDPSHWDSVLKHENSSIALTLSGHTHGMQFALNFNGKSWSPVQWKYKQWRGLYTHGDKNLYVNIGLGNIAYPGRVGTPPEITVFELNVES